MIPAFLLGSFVLPFDSFSSRSQASLFVRLLPFIFISLDYIPTIYTGTALLFLRIIYILSDFHSSSIYFLPLRLNVRTSLLFLTLCLFLSVLHILLCLVLTNNDNKNNSNNNNISFSINFFIHTTA